MLFDAATANSTAQHSTAQHSTAQHSTAQHSTAQRTDLASRWPAIRSTVLNDSWCFLFQPAVLGNPLHSVEGILSHTGKPHSHGGQGGNLQGVRQRKAHLGGRPSGFNG